MFVAWDPRKAEANRKSHLVAFDEALTVFFDPMAATFFDKEHSLGEERLITIGYSRSNRLLVVSHTERNDTLRIISAREATAHERKKHEG
jgi:uncharacterized protein